MAAGRTEDRSRSRRPAATGTRLRAADWYYPALGVLLGAALLLVFPLASAVAALAVAAVGIALSEVNAHVLARRVLLAGAGMMLAPLAYLIWQIARLR